MPTFMDKLKAYGLQALIGLLALIGGNLSLFFKPNPPVVVPPAAGVPQPMPAPAAAPQPWEAIGKIQLGTFGCSATIIGPRRTEGTYDVLSASHCLPPGVTTGVMLLDSGKKLGIQVITHDPVADVSWLRTVADVGELPFALLADDLPAVGEPVWHGGFGVDKPRNKESGTVVDPSTAKGQTHYLLSVSHGDSGGGIICNATGRVLSSVCCTTAVNQKADVWGCNVRAIKAARPKDHVGVFDWTPIDVPHVEK